MRNFTTTFPIPYLDPIQDAEHPTLSVIETKIQDYDTCIQAFAGSLHSRNHRQSLVEGAAIDTRDHRKPPRNTAVQQVSVLSMRLSLCLRAPKKRIFLRVSDLIQSLGLDLSTFKPSGRKYPYWITNVNQDHRFSQAAHFGVSVTWWGAPQGHLTNGTGSAMIQLVEGPPFGYDPGAVMYDEKLMLRQVVNRNGLGTSPFASPTFPT